MKMKRIISLTVAVLLAVTTFFSVPQMATVAYADNGDPAITLRAEALAKNANTKNTQILKYGGHDWFVIGYEEGKTVTLFSKGLLAEEQPFSVYGADHDEYGRSLLKTFLEDLVDRDFSVEEKSAILPRTLTTEDGINGDTVFDSLLWPLSTEEAMAVVEDLRVPIFGSHVSPYFYWLRSSDNTHNGTWVKRVEPEGGISANQSGNRHAARAAFSFDISSSSPVLFASTTKGGKASNGIGPNALNIVGTSSTNEWSLTVRDPEREFAVTSSNLVDNTLTIDYKDAKTGENEYISALITNSSGKVTYYGRVAQVPDEEQASGEVAINLSGKFNEGDTIYVFNEQYWSNDKTSYSSDMISATIVFDDKTDIYNSDEQPVYLYQGDDSLEQHPAVLIRKLDGTVTDGEGSYQAVYNKLDGAGEMDVRPIQPGRYVMKVYGAGDMQGRFPEAERRFEIREAERYTLAFYSNKSAGDTNFNIIYAYEGQVISGIPSYSNDPYVFDGWYTDKACTEGNKVDLSAPITGQEPWLTGSSATLYAKWIHEHPMTRVDKKEATCTEAGYEEYWICETCNKLFSDYSGKNEIQGPVEIPIDPNAHDFGEWEVTAPATETKEGVETKTCSLCEEKETRSFPKIGSIALSVSKYTFNGKEKKPGIVVKDANGDEISSENYTVSYANNINAGTAAATVTFNDKRYSGTKKLSFTIDPKEITPKVTLSKASFVYTGKALKPTVTVKDGSTTLASSQYKVTYSPSACKNVGKVSVKVTLKGNYSGTKTVSYKINPKGRSISSVTPLSKAITVKWTKQATKMSTSYISGYQIYVATDSAFTKNVKKMYVEKYSTVSKKVTGLKGGTKYYVKMRTYKTVNGVKYYSPWSAVKTVTTKK